MTEYLINWNEIENNTRNFDFTKDFFNFFRAINTCMIGDFNAWVHYSAKRYYGMLGDGQRGTSSGTVTKRGYIMAHFARFVTGMTRIDATWGDTPLEGSAYLSQTGDTVVAVMANATDEAVTATFDLPFYTISGKLYTTGKSRSFTGTTLKPQEETCRPAATIAAQSVCTVLFVRSRDRQPSDMTGTMTRFDRLDDMSTTNTNFGTTYKLSGQTKTFDHSNPLISSRTNTSSGYVALSDRFSQLVMQVKTMSSTLNYSSAKTTLVYVNGKGKVASHDYGDLDLGRRENFSLVFDLSPQTLTDGCKGIISMTNNNWSSTLTITFGDVYLASGPLAPYAATLTGAYVEDDSNVLDFTADAACTSLDLTACTQCPSKFPWLEGSNRVVWLPEYSSEGANLVHNDLCHSLVLSTEGGPFRPARSFQADAITLTTTIDGYRLMMLPFNAEIPQGVKAYAINASLDVEELSAIPAHTPVLVKAQGEVAFTGQGEVGFATSPLTARLRGTYTPFSLYAGDYVLAQQNGQWGFLRVEESTELSPFNVYATLASQEAFIPLELPNTDIKGDVNSDGKVDVADIASIISVMANGEESAAADVNSDGKVDVADIATVISIMAEASRQLQNESSF